MAASFGHSQDHTRCTGMRPGGRTVVSTTSRVASPAASSVAIEVSTHLVLQPVRDPAGDPRQLGRVEGAWPRQVHLHLVGDAARPAGEDEHAVPESYCLASVV